MNGRLSILIVGVGSIGERHLRCFQSTGRADLSICEINPSLRNLIAERYRVSNSFGTMEEALAGKPQAVVVCTPAHTHVSIALAASRINAHMLIEKPLSTTMDDVVNLQQAVLERNLVASVAYVYRAHPAIASMRAAIQSGQFGKPLQIVVVSGQHFPFYRPAYRETYYASHRTGGGAIQDAITHMINAAEWIVGPVDALVADADHLALPGVEVEDTVHLLTRHGGVMGSFSLNQHQAPNETSITVVCDRGTARFEFHINSWSRSLKPGEPWEVVWNEPLERDALFTYQAEAFLETIEGRRTPLCSLQEGVQSLRVNLAMLQSVKSRCWELLNNK